MFCNGLNDTSFDAWAPEVEILQKQPLGLASPMSVDSQVKQHILLKSEDKENCYLLVKNFPQNISESEVWNVFQDSMSLEKVIILSNINNVYLKFTSMVEIQTIISSNDSMPTVYKGQKLKMCSVLKLPLDLNKGSKVLLLTLYDEKIEITAQVIYQVFKDDSLPLRVIIFKKKNYQIFIEFETVEEAFLFKEKFDNINLKGFFFLKVQFTKKNSLNISKNSPMEHDFTTLENNKLRIRTVDFNFEEAISGYSKNRPTNIVPSLQNFDDFSESQKCAHPSKDFQPDLTLDTSEDKTEYNYILILSNLHPDIKHKALFNLFSLYGNIEKISVDTNHKKATIFYPSEFEQMTAHHCLDNLTLFGLLLSLEPTKTAKTSHKSSQYPNLVTYKKGIENPQMNMLSKLRVINKPLNILYIFNLSPNASLEIIRNLFAMYSPVVNIQYSNESRNSALVFLKSVEEAVRILCLFKNTNLIDKSLKINFANNNLLKGKEPNLERRKSKFVSLQNFHECSNLLDFDVTVRQNRNKLTDASPAFKLLKGPI